MERSAALGQPAGRPDGDLDSSPEPALGRAGGGIHLVAVRSSKYEEVDVAHWSIALLSGELCRPGSVHIRGVDPSDAGQGLAEHPRNAERLDEHVRQAAEIRARWVGADEPCPSDEPARDQAGGVGALDLAVDRRIRNAGSLGELNKAVLDRRVAEDERQQFALLLRPEDRQE